MPLGITIRQSNRSQQALENSLAQAQTQRGPPINQPTSSVGPGDEDKVYEARSAHPPPYINTRNEIPTYLATNNGQGGDSSAYQESADRPSRSQSHRVTANYPQIQPLSSVGEPRGAVDDQALTDYGRSYNTGPAPRPQQTVVEQKKNKSRFFGFNSKPNRPTDQPPLAEQPPSSSHNNLSGLGRRISIRHKEAPPIFQSQAQNVSSDKQHQLQGWQSAHSSESQLPSPNEVDEDESGANRYIIHQSDQETDRLQEPTHDQLSNPTIRLGGGDQESTVRLVDEGWYHQYQQQPTHIITQQQQWIAQQNQQLANSPVPISPVGQQQNEYPSNPLPGQYPTYPIPSNPVPPPHPQLRSSTNPEVISQLSHDSPVEVGEDQRPASVQSNNQTPAAPANYSSHLQSDYPPRVTSIQGSRPLGQQSAMPPPPPPSGTNRRSTDVKQTLQQDSRNNVPPPSYTQQQFPVPNQGPAPGSGNPLSQPPPVQQATNYRGPSIQREYVQPGVAGEQGRSTPPLPGDLSEMEKLVIKYKKVKGLYFEKQAQVEQLQNTLANQRLSQSRTSLDDSEYITRFNRLDGAIKEIAFSIRKDWKIIPRWLVPYVNQDAQKTGTKEMTAVGRAAISRWINEEIFNKCFHPGLEMSLSSELKRIEQNLRFFAPPTTSLEESEMLTSKVVQWKLSTVDGLGYMLSSPNSHEAKAVFTQMCVSNLTAHLIQHLQDPPPQGIEGNATSIVELAVGIVCHLPFESRDISIIYPLPGDPVLPTYKVEATLPPLENPGPDPSADTDGSTQSDGKDQNSEADAGKGDSSVQKLSKKPQDKKNLPQLQPQNSINGKKMPVGAAGVGEPGQEKGKDRGDGPQRVRFAGFVGVEVRGRQGLVSPPVWTM